MANAFKIVKDVGLTLPDVEATTKYDGSPVLKLDGVFVAGLASHSSAEPDSLVVRVGLEERELLSALSNRARPAVAHRSRRTARSAFCVAPAGPRENTPTPD
jgi:hypothetical protein